MEEYASWLAQQHWDYFITVTQRHPHKHAYALREYVWSTLYDHNAAKAFLCVEPHYQTGQLHLHGLVSGSAPGWRPEIDLPWEIWETLFERFGRSKVELVKSQNDVAAYCSKYVSKYVGVDDAYDVYGSRFAWKI